jgi:hypothetical protein
MTRNMNGTKGSQSNTNKRPNWRKLFRPRPRRQDPMLVLNMSAFNFEPGWNRVFNPVPARENIWW